MTSLKYTSETWYNKDMKKQAEKIVRYEEKEDLSYEKDPRFIEFIKRRIEISKDRSRLVDGHEATRRIREELGLNCERV